MTRKIPVWKITLGGVLTAFGILLPQLFHIFGPAAGKMLLPMHLCVFVGGMVLGPLFGSCVGVLTPLASFLLTGMPGVPTVFFMVVELAAYGCFAGLFYRRWRQNLMVSLLLSQLCGRLIYALLLYAAGGLFRLPVPGAATVLAAVGTGLPGILLQLVMVPAMVLALGKVSERFGIDIRRKKSSTENSC